MTYRSPLHPVHVRLGARFSVFGGWEMPLRYPAGTLAEHRACRDGCAVFDVSHLGSVLVAGEGAYSCLQRTFTNDLGKIEPGRAQYTHLLDPQTASVADDCIIWWESEATFHVMPNAANTSGVVNALSEETSGSEPAHIEDVTSTRAVVAIQGPDARHMLRRLAEQAGSPMEGAPYEVRHLGVAPFRWMGHDALVAGTGYSGEDGVECAIPASVAPGFFESLVGHGCVPAGLAARDTLRLEAGLPLHGHELGPGITPYEAGLSWVVSWEKGPFRGREALDRHRASGIKQSIRGLVATGRQPPRAGDEVRRGDAPGGAGEKLGTVTSGNYSPGLGSGIALALLSKTVMPGERVVALVRGKELPCEVVTPPFVPTGLERAKRSL